MGWISCLSLAERSAKLSITTRLHRRHFSSTPSGRSRARRLPHPQRQSCETPPAGAGAGATCTPLAGQDGPSWTLLSRRASDVPTREALGSPKYFSMSTLIIDVLRGKPRPEGLG